MHICFISREYPPSLRGGGIASYVKEMAIGLQELGHRVTVIAASDDTKRSFEYSDGGVRVIRLEGGDFVIPQVEGTSFIKKFRIFYRFYSYRKKVLETVCRLKDVDIIEVPEYGAESYFLDKLQTPVVVRLHTPAMFDREKLGIIQYHGLNKIFAWIGHKEFSQIKKTKYLSSCSKALSDWTVKNLGVERNRIKVIYNPVSLPQVSHLQLVSKKPKLSIVFVGTISEVKGCQDLFEAGKILRQKSIDFDMFLYGKMGEYAKNLKTNEKNYPWFHVMGKVERKQVFSICQEATVVCFPSWWDNMPMVCLEAMGVGSIVLGSASGGMGEIIEDQKNGFLIEPHNPQSLADKIIDIINLSEEKRNEISENAKARIQQVFSKAVVMKQMVEYYQKVIATKKK